MQCSTAPRFLNYTTDRVRQQQRLKKKTSFIRHRTRQTPSLLPPRSGMKLVRRRGRSVKHLRFEDDFDSGMRHKEILYRRMNS
jgi:hypothetical protein